MRKRGLLSVAAAFTVALIASAMAAIAAAETQTALQSQPQAGAHDQNGHDHGKTPLPECGRWRALRGDGRQRPQGRGAYVRGSTNCYNRYVEMFRTLAEDGLGAQRQ